MREVLTEEFDKLPVQTQINYKFCVVCNMFFLNHQISTHSCASYILDPRD